MQETTGPADHELKINFRNRLVTQINLDLQEISKSIVQLRNEMNSATYLWQRWSIGLVLSSLMIMLAIIIANSVFISKTLIGPVRRLQDGAEIIGRGNLDYKLASNSPDEIGQLSGAFDQMTANLKGLTVSRDELLREVDERRRAEEEAHRLATFPQLNPNPVVEVDSAGNLTYANPATWKVVKQLGLQDVTALLPSDMAAILEEAGETGQTNFYRELEVGEANLAAFISFPSDFNVARIYFLDITELKRAEQALRQVRDELEQRVQERTEELRHTVVQLQEEVTERQQAEKALQESQESLRYLTSKILTAQEQERKRIAMELHEGLAQSMTTLKMFLRTLQRHLPTESGSINEDFETAHNLILGMIGEVRRISKGLSPALLENLGLTAALKHLLEEFRTYQNVAINEGIDNIQNLFSPQTEVNLFRVFQEFLNNIAKHAHATQVSVSIKKQEGRVDFLIQDNGVGFDLKQILSEKSADRGLGLAAMDERLRMIGAQLNIMSQPGMGTEISFSIPTEAAAKPQFLSS